MSLSSSSYCNLTWNLLKHLKSYFKDTGEDGIDEKPVVDDDDDDDEDDKGGDETESGLDLHSSSYSFGTVYEVSGMIGKILKLLRWT